jgi:hypothetical protein
MDSRGIRAGILTTDIFIIVMQIARNEERTKSLYPAQPAQKVS